MTRFARLLSIAAAALPTAACSSLTYDQLPGPTDTLARTVQADPDRVCDAVAAAAADLRLAVDRRYASERGCIVELGRRTPWWRADDDGERLRIEVALHGAASDVTAHARRVAPGQVWLDSMAAPLLAGIERHLAASDRQ